MYVVQGSDTAQSGAVQTEVNQLVAYVRACVSALWGYRTFQKEFGVPNRFRPLHSANLLRGASGRVQTSGTVVTSVESPLSGHLPSPPWNICFVLALERLTTIFPP